MTTTWKLAALVAGLASTLAGSALAHEYKLGDLEIGHPWAQATAKGQPTAAAYMTIENGGSADDKLLSASAPFAKKAELHMMSMENGVMKMRPVEGGIDLPPGKTVKLEPNGLHIMLIGRGEQLTAGTRVPLHLVFQKAGKIDVQLAVEKPGFKMDDHAGHDDHEAAKPMKMGS